MAEDQQARYRDRSDAAYLEAHRDNLLHHQRKVGHTPQWIAVLNGTAPGILLPNGNVDQDELDRCRQAAIDMHGGEAPEAVYNDELRQYLRPEQLDALRNGKPTIMMAFVERQLVLRKHPERNLLQKRVRDGIEFGLAESMQFIGRLMSLTQARSISLETAGQNARDRIDETWWPDGARLKTKDRPKTLRSMFDAGNLEDRRAHYVDPNEANNLIKAEVEIIRTSTKTSNLSYQFHYTVFAGLLHCKLHDSEHASAQRRMSRAIQILKVPADWGDLLEFMGVTRPAVSLVDVLALAYVDVPDAFRLFPAFHFYYPDMEVAAVLGALSRNRPVRIDEKTARRLSKILSIPESEPVQVSADYAPPLMSPEQFLRYAMGRIGSDHWWAEMLVIPADNFGCRYVRKGDSAPPGDTAATGFPLEQLQSDPILGKLALFLFSRFDLLMKPLGRTRIWRYSELSEAATLDLDNMAKYCRDNVSLMTQVLVEFAAVGWKTEFDLKDAQTNDPHRPGYYREMVRVASASCTVMQKFAPELCERRKLDLDFYARFLTDLEFKELHLFGEVTGYAILATLGHDVTKEVEEITLRRNRLYAEHTSPYAGRTENTR